MKKIINDPFNVVKDMMYGMAIANPELRIDNQHMFVARKEKPEKVGLVSGGGSGHEPAHAGYVGPGMLDVAVCGNVFTSPPQDNVLHGIHEANTGKGVLLIIKNYSGDIMNFEMAKEFAELEGIKVKSVVVRDDVAVPDSTYSTGRRGISGTIFVHKIAGACAEQGASLVQVYDVAMKTINNLRSMGMAMSPCILPSVGKPSFYIDEDEMVMGMGIHGEPGVRKGKMKTAAGIANELCSTILADYDYTNSNTAVMINGLGSTTLMELNILVGEVSKILDKSNIRVHKYMVGNFMTSLEMSGCSLSILKLDDELASLLDAPCDTPALRQR